MDALIFIHTCYYLLHFHVGGLQNSRLCSSPWKWLVGFGIIKRLRCESSAFFIRKFLFLSLVYTIPLLQCICNMHVCAYIHVHAFFSSLSCMCIPCVSLWPQMLSFWNRLAFGIGLVSCWCNVLVHRWAEVVWEVAISFCCNNELERLFLWIKF